MLFISGQKTRRTGGARLRLLPLSRYGIVYVFVTADCITALLLSLQDGLAVTAWWLGHPDCLTYKTVGRAFLCMYPYRIAFLLAILYHSFQTRIRSSRNPNHISNVNIGLIHT